MTAASPSSPSAAFAQIRVILQERLRNNTLHLPVLPQVAGEVMALTQDLRTELSDLSKLIHRDQALASHVLRISNSAAYSTGETFTSLQQAVAHVGLRLLSELTIAISLHGEVFRVPGFQPEVKYLWRHALASAIYGREIARLKGTDEESQFLCGLLHSVGKPIALQAVVELLRERKTGLPRTEVLTLVEEFYGLVSQKVTAKWKLPEPVRYSAAYYRNPSESPAYRTETTITQLAHQLADWLTSPDGTQNPPANDSPALTALQLSPDQLKVLISKRANVLSVVNALDV